MLYYYLESRKFREMRSSENRPPVNSMVYKNGHRKPPPLHFYNIHGLSMGFSSLSPFKTGHLRHLAGCPDHQVPTHRFAHEDVGNGRL